MSNVSTPPPCTFSPSHFVLGDLVNASPLRATILHVTNAFNWLKIFIFWVSIVAWVSFIPLPGPLATTFCGGMGGAALWIAVFPADVIKSRAQVAAAGTDHSLGFIGTFMHILRTEGGYMMMSWHGNAFNIIGPLCGESMGYWWIPLTKDQWYHALTLALLLARTSYWTNHWVVSDLRWHNALVMSPQWSQYVIQWCYIYISLCDTEASYLILWCSAVISLCNIVHVILWYNGIISHCVM